MKNRPVRHRIEYGLYLALKGLLRALPHEAAVNEIERCSGSQFDPEVASTFVKWLDQFREELATTGVIVPE